MTTNLPKDDLTDQEKAKDTFSIHQDNLFWSRTQTLIAIQGGVLAGAFALREALSLSVPLLALGICLTVILCIIAERDQLHRDLAFKQSTIVGTRNGIAVGRWLIRLVFVLMISADVYLLVWLFWPGSAVSP